MAIKDLTGQRFGKLVVLYKARKRRHGSVVWHCRCDCGNEVDVRSDHLVRGNTMSCGCYRRFRTAERHFVHGLSYHPLYQTWRVLLQRCENPNNKSYKNYGGRGIKVCDEWHGVREFIDWALANGWARGLQLDRLDNNGNYAAANCRWVLYQEKKRKRS